MSEARPTPDDARELLAAEYVMGLTERADLAVVETMILRDPAFAAAIAGWRERLSPLDATAPPERTDERLWASIESALAGTPAPAASPAPPRAATAPAPAPTLRPAARPASAPPRAPARQPARPGLWSSLALWRAAGLSSAFAALLLAAGLGYARRQASRQPVLVAVLMTDANRAAAIVNAYADGRAEMTPLVDLQIPDGKAVEIWTLWDRSVGPRSVGLMQRMGKATLKLEGMPRPTPGQIFEMTLEPATGSPTGRPTGPVLNKGEATTAL